MFSAISLTLRYHPNLDCMEMDAGRQPIDRPTPPLLIYGFLAILRSQGFAWADITVNEFVGCLLLLDECVASWARQFFRESGFWFKALKFEAKKSQPSFEDLIFWSFEMSLTTPLNGSKMTVNLPILIALIETLQTPDNVVLCCC